MSGYRTRVCRYRIALGCLDPELLQDAYTHPTRSKSLVAGVGPWEDETGKTASLALRGRNREAYAKRMRAFSSCLLEVPPFAIVRDLADPLF